MPLDYIKVIRQRVLENRPDIDFRDGSAVCDLLGLPITYLQKPLADEIVFISSQLSLVDAGILTIEEANQLIANIYLTRRLGDQASGLARVFLETPVAVTFETTDTFIADNGSEYTPVSLTSYSESLVRLNTEGSLFYVDVPVIATVSGSAGRIDANQLSTIRGTSVSFVRVDNPFPFTGGSDEETNEELKVRGTKAITVRDLVSGNGVFTKLQETFTFIERIFVAGFLDPEMQRDLSPDGVHTGGYGDVYVKSASLQAELVKILTPDADGDFVLSGSSGPGDNKRPVVFIDSVRLLDGATNPTGTALNREESELIPFTGLASTGTYLEPHIAYNPTLQQISLVAIEVVSSMERYVVYSRLDLSGAVQIPFTRISPASTTASHPHVAINTTLNRAYVFWADGTVLMSKVLNVAGGALVTVKDTFTLAGGTNPVQDRIDSAVAADGDIHIAFARRNTAIDGTTQDNPWYARMDTNGNQVGAIAPFQLVFDLSGNNRHPTITTQGSAGTLIVTVAWSSQLTDSSNIYAIQVNNAGTLIQVSPVALTVGFNQNDLPTIRPGPSSTIHLVWRINGTGINYMRLIASGLGVTIPTVATLTRTQEITDVRAMVNSFGSIYAYWSEFVGDFTDIFTAKIDTLGRRIGDIQDVTKTAYPSSFPTMVTDTSGALHLVWLDGVKGGDKPFYTKRSPQEWHLLVVDENLRYSVQEQLQFVVEIPAASGIGVDLRWASQVPSVQTYVDSDTERTIVANLLVKNQIPASATCAIRFGPFGGTLTEVAAKALIEDYINEFEGSSFEPSALVDLLFNNGATAVDLPFTVTIKIDQIDGTIETRSGTSSIALPRGVFLEAKNVTATFIK